MRRRPRSWLPMLCGALVVLGAGAVPAVVNAGQPEAQSPPPLSPTPPCPALTPASPAPEGRQGMVIVGQPSPCPPADRTPGDFAITTAFGDGTSAPTPVTDDRLWFVGGPHTYRRAGTYTATATMTDRTTGAVTTLRRPIVVPTRR